MAVLSVEEFLDKIRERSGDDASDETLQFIEDATDTLNSMSKNDGEDWQKKYEENDKAWRKKYKDRFFSTGDSAESNLDSKDDDEKEDDEEHEKTINELFSTGGK